MVPVLCPIFNVKTKKLQLGTKNIIKPNLDGAHIETQSSADTGQDGQGNTGQHTCSAHFEKQSVVLCSSCVMAVAYYYDYLRNLSSEYDSENKLRILY